MSAKYALSFASQTGLERERQKIPMILFYAHFQKLAQMGDYFCIFFIKATSALYLDSVLSFKWKSGNRAFLSPRAPPCSPASHSLFLSATAVDENNTVKIVTEKCIFKVQHRDLKQLIRLLKALYYDHIHIFSSWILLEQMCTINYPKSISTSVHNFLQRHLLLASW